MLVEGSCGDFAIAFPLLPFSRPQIWSKYVKHLQHLRRPSELSLASKNASHSLRIAELQPIFPRRDEDECITLLLVRLIAILDLPPPPIEAYAVAESKG